MFLALQHSAYMCPLPSMFWLLKRFFWGEGGVSFVSAISSSDSRGKWAWSTAIVPVSVGTKRRSQVTSPGHRSQVTENSINKVIHSAGLFMFIGLFYFRLRDNQSCVWHRLWFPFCSEPRFKSLRLERRQSLVWRTPSNRTEEGTLQVPIHV